MSLKNRIIGLAAIGAAALTLAPAALAKAPTGGSSVTTTSSTTTTPLISDTACTDPATPVFAPWGDSAFYSLVGGGDFESGADGWSLAGGAKVVRDRDDALVSDGVADQYALELGSGASATSPAICVATDSAFYRFFANAVTSKGKGANLRVEVLGPRGSTLASTELTIPVGTSAPSPKLAFVPQWIDSLLAEYTSGYSTTASIRVTSLDGATVRIDGVHMDPRMH